MSRGTEFLVVVALATAVSMTGVTAQQGTRGEWRSYNGDTGSTKYAPLDQINKSNVSRVEILWRRPPVDASVMARNPDLRFSNNFRATPIMVDGVL